MDQPPMSRNLYELMLPFGYHPKRHDIQTCIITCWAATRMQWVDAFLWRFKRRIVGAFAMCIGALLFVASCWGEGLVTITFDGYPWQPPGSRYGRTNYYELGTTFIGDFTRAFPPSSTSQPDNGTAYIAPTWPAMTCSRLDNLHFRLVSVDLAVYSSGFPDDPASFEGHRSDGSVVTTNFPVSGLTFQTYYFSSEFADLTNVLVRAGALDNLELQLPTIQPVLSIRSYNYHGDSWFVLQAQGTLGLRYRMEYTDFFPATNWITLATFESSFYKEIVTTNHPPQRCFRAVELP